MKIFGTTLVIIIFSAFCIGCSKKYEPPPQTDCKFDCRQYGRCTFVNGRCKATKPKHCTKSTMCARFGYCGLNKERCRPTLEKHCKASTSCEKYGSCGLFDTGNGIACRPLIQKHCQKSLMCKHRGNCFLPTKIDGRINCVIVSQKHCRDSFRCLRFGLCTYVDRSASKKVNICEAQKQDCTNSCFCKKLGRCTPVKGVCMRSQKTTLTDHQRYQDFQACKGWSISEMVEINK